MSICTPFESTAWPSTKFAAAALWPAACASLVLLPLERATAAARAAESLATWTSVAAVVRWATSIAMAASARTAPSHTATATSAKPRSLRSPARMSRTSRRTIRSTTPPLVGEADRAVHLEAARAAAAAEPQDVEQVRDAAVDVDRHGWRRVRRGGTWRAGGCYWARLLVDRHGEGLRRPDVST